MADLVLAYDIANDTAADAVPVQSNYTRIESHVNNNVIRTDGATAMTAPLQLFGDPVDSNDAVRKGFLDMLMPVGVILPYAGVAVPGGLWALANGAPLATAVYPTLFAAIGYNFGGSGSSFNLPDVRGRTMIGRSGANPLFVNMNAPGGSADAAIVLHSHSGVAHNHSTPNHTHPGTSASVGNHYHSVNAVAVVAGGPNGNATVQRMPAYAYNKGLAMQDSNGDGVPDSGGIAGFGMTWEESEYIPNHDTNSTSIGIATSTPSGGGGTSGDASAATAPSGVSATNANLPPYIVVNYIVRVS